MVRLGLEIYLFMGIDVRFTGLPKEYKPEHRQF